MDKDQTNQKVNKSISLKNLDAQLWDYFERNYIKNPFDPLSKRSQTDAFALMAKDAISKTKFSAVFANNYPEFEAVKKLLEKERGMTLSNQETFVEMIKTLQPMVNAAIDEHTINALTEIDALAENIGQSRHTLLNEAITLLNHKFSKALKASKKEAETKAGRPRGLAYDNIRQLIDTIKKHNEYAPKHKKIYINKGVLNVGIPEEYWQHYGIQIKGTRSDRVPEYIERPEVKEELEEHHTEMGLFDENHNRDVMRRIRLGQPFDDMLDND